MILRGFIGDFVCVNNHSSTDKNIPCNPTTYFSHGLHLLGGPQNTFLVPIWYSILRQIPLPSSAHQDPSQCWWWPLNLRYCGGSHYSGLFAFRNLSVTTATVSANIAEAAPTYVLRFHDRLITPEKCWSANVQRVNTHACVHVCACMCESPIATHPPGKLVTLLCDLSAQLYLNITKFPWCLRKNKLPIFFCMLVGSDSAGAGGLQTNGTVLLPHVG